MSLESMSKTSPSSTPRHQRKQDMTVLASPVSAGLVSGLVCLVVVLVAFTPLFLCMPLWVDATHYDVCARNLLEGGVHYRDTLDPNFPGVVWIHVAVRQLLGWSSEALRAFDLAVFSGIVWLVWRLLTVAGAAPAVRVWAAVALYGFYFSLPETCHCQRDVWMLFFAMLALQLRQRTLTGSVPHILRLQLLRSIAEGLLWGAAIWIKPFVFVPAICCWLGGRLATTRRTTLHGSVDTRFQTAWFLDLIGLLAGGLAAGAAGLIWLWASGSWPWFLEVMLEWNGEYIDNRNFLLNRTLNWLFWTLHFAPWSLVNLLAIPIALRMVLPLRLRQPSAQEIPGVLVASLYLGWMLQANFLQVQHDYVQASTILPGLAVLFMRAASWQVSPFRRMLLLAVLVLLVVQHPLAKREPISCWARCWQQGSTPEMRDQLAQVRGAGGAAWQDLKKVEGFLRQQSVQDGELTCWDDSSAPLFISLNIKPSNRFIHNHVWTMFYPSRRSAMLEELAASPQKFVVNDLRLGGFTQQQMDAMAAGELDSLTPLLPKQTERRFPWSEPIIYRAGPYVVHAVGPSAEVQTKSKTAAEK
jgi:hypothetical protein